MALKNFFTIEDDIVYVEAHEIGLQKGIEKGLEEGIQTGLEKGKIEGEDLKEHIAAFNMLDKSFELDLIGGILEIPNAKVEAIKKLWELDQKIKELAAAERKTIAQAAKILKVKRDVFAKLKEIEADRKKR